MSDATLAVVFVLMLIAPCAVALTGDRRKVKGTSAAPAERKDAARPSVAMKAVLVASTSGSVPVFAPDAEMETAAVAPSRMYAHGPDPYEKAAKLYAQPESSFVEPYQQTPVRGRWHEIDGAEASPEAAYLPEAVAYSQPSYAMRSAAEMAEAEALLAQAAAAKAHAAALAAAARTAQAKAHAAAERANQAARAAELAHQAADHERDVQAQITAQEHARTASGEHLLPESHPSLDFPRSGPGRGRRAA